MKKFVKVSLKRPEDIIEYETVCDDSYFSGKQAALIWAMRNGAKENDILNINLGYGGYDYRIIKSYNDLSRLGYWVEMI